MTFAAGTCRVVDTTDQVEERTDHEQSMYDADTPTMRRSQREAFEARRAATARRQDEDRTPDEPAAEDGFGFAECGALLDEANRLWQVARDLYDRGELDEGDSTAQQALEVDKQYNECVLTESLAPPDELFGGPGG